MRVVQFCDGIVHTQARRALEPPSQEPREPPSQELREPPSQERRHQEAKAKSFDESVREGLLTGKELQELLGPEGSRRPGAPRSPPADSRSP